MRYKLDGGARHPSCAVLHLSLIDPSIYPPAIDDTLVPGQPCACEFTPYPAGSEDEGEESWHYLRRCQACRHLWYGVHCPHDGVQNPCPKCGAVPAVIAQDVAL